MLTLEKATLHRIAKDIDLWCNKSSDDLHRYMYVLGPFDGFNSHLIQELVNILSEWKQLKVLHLHVFLHSNIKHVNLSVCSFLVSDQVLGMLGYRCKKLTQLCLKNCTRLSTKALKEISKNLPLLCNIDMSGCPACTDDVLQQLGTSCPQLRILRLNSCSQVTDAGIAALCGEENNPRCRLLQEINLTSTTVTNVGLRMVLLTQSELLKIFMAIPSSNDAFNFGDLKTTRLICADFSYTSISDSSVKSLCEICPLLSELSISCCTSVTGVTLQCIALLKHLRSLNIAGNFAIQFQPHLEEFLMSSGAALETLNISGMKNVDTQIVGLYCRSLRSLVIADCEGVSGNFISVAGLQTGLLSLAKACCNLESLNLHGCKFSHGKPVPEHLLALISGSIHLLELDLSGIEKVDDGVISQFVQSSSLSCLRSLNLSQCSQITSEAIETLVKTCKSLTRLDLSYCKQISLQDVENLRKLSKEQGGRAKIIWV